MSDLRDLSAFTLPLALGAHSRAKGFQQHHAAPAVQKRVYLNTLAVHAVETYLDYLGYGADLRTSHSQNPAQQTLMDVADLQVETLGRLECRPLLPGETAIAVPPEVWADRIGYVLVQLDESLRQATLLGFAKALPDSHRLAVENLLPLEDLGEYLEQLAADPAPIRLGRWLQQVTEAGWQALTDIAGNLASAPAPAFAFRGMGSSAEAEAQTVPQIGQSKPIILGQGQTAVTVNLLVGLIPQANDEIEIWAQVSPAADQTHLPPQLQLLVLDQEGEPVMQAEARNTEAIQLKFVAAAGEQFGIRVALAENSVTETFEV